MQGIECRVINNKSLKKARLINWRHQKKIKIGRIGTFVGVHKLKGHKNFIVKGFFGSLKQQVRRSNGHYIKAQNTGIILLGPEEQNICNEPLFLEVRSQVLNFLHFKFFI